MGQQIKEEWKEILSCGIGFASRADAHSTEICVYVSKRPLYFRTSRISSTTPRLGTTPTKTLLSLILTGTNQPSRHRATIPAGLNRLRSCSIIAKQLITISSNTLPSTFANNLPRLELSHFPLVPLNTARILPLPSDTSSKMDL